MPSQFRPLKDSSTATFYKFEKAGQSIYAVFRKEISQQEYQKEIAKKEAEVQVLQAKDEAEIARKAQEEHAAKLATEQAALQDMQTLLK